MEEFLTIQSTHNSERSEAIIAYYELSVDVVDVVVDSRCCISPMAELLTTKLSTSTLRDVTSSPSDSSESCCIFSSVALSFLTTNLQNVTVDIGDLFLVIDIVATKHWPTSWLKLSEDACSVLLWRHSAVVPPLTR